MLVELVGILFFLQFLQHHHRLQSRKNNIKNQNYYLCFSFTYVKTVTGRRLDYNLINKTDVEYIQNLIPPCLILPTFHCLNPPLSTAISQTLFQYCDIIALNLLLWEYFIFLECYSDIMIIFSYLHLRREKYAESKGRINQTEKEFFSLSLSFNVHVFQEGLPLDPSMFFSQ